MTSVEASFNVVDQPSKVYPERVGEVGAEMLPPDWNDALATEDPPLLSKVAV